MNSTANRVPIRILLVEDDPGDALLFQELLARTSGLDFHLERVTCLADAVSRAAAANIDIIVLDLSLPDSRGFDTFVRLHSAVPLIPLIVLTGLEDEELATRTVQHGAQDYIVKGRSDGNLLSRSIRYAIERQRAQAAIAHEQALLRSLIDNIPDQVYLKDTDSRFLSVNLKAAQFFGASSEDQVVGKSDVDYFPREVAAQFYAEEQNLLHSGQPCVNREVAVTGLNGNARWMLTTKVPLRNSSGHTIGLLGINRDITDRKQTEDTIRRLNADLEQRVIERTAELRIANDALRANDRARSEFVSNVSHELKTPLASMKLALDNMLRGIGGSISAQSHSYLDMLRKDCRRLIGTVNDILDASRIEAGKMKLDRLRIPFAWFVRHTAESLRMQVEEHHLEMRVEADDEAAFVECDPEKMERVILNVIRNAIKFTPAGGVVDIVARSDPASSGHVILDIVDSGMGIEAAHLPHVTERYYRVGEHISGTGLGLHISRNVVELHGGRLTLTSPPTGRENGTQVSIRLPTAEPPTVAIAADGAIPSAVQTQAGVCAFRWAVCRDGPEALSMARDRHMEAMIVDMDLPALGGLQLIMQVKSDPNLRHLPIMAVSGRVTEGTKRDLLDSLAIPVLCRPWTSEAFMGLLMEAIIGNRSAQG